MTEGKLAIPTADEWRLAAGRAEHPGAVYPSTGAFLDGSDLASRLAERERGGAAWGFDRNKMTVEPTRYAPGAFGLYHMAGNAWEIVQDSDGQWDLLGGCCSSPKEECRLDGAPVRWSTRLRGMVGFRLVWRP